MKRTSMGLLLIAISIACGLAVQGQDDVGPAQIIEADLPILAVDGGGDPEVIARGAIELPDDCDYCLVHPIQYRIRVPDDVVRLVIELYNTTDDGDIDLIVREAEPVAEDEFTFYFDTRTYGIGGDEVLELPEEGSGGVTAGDYFIGIVSYAETGTEYEIRAAAYVEQVLPTAVELESNVPVIGQLEPGGLSGDLESQYHYQVPEDAALTVIYASSRQGNVDVLFGWDPIVRGGNGRLQADAAVRASGSDELVMLGEPGPGGLWIIVENDTPDRTSYELVVTSVPAIVDLAVDAQLAATVGDETSLIPLLGDYLRTEGGMLGLTQYRLALPEGLSALRIALHGNEVCDIGLHLRYGEPVNVVDGAVVADLSATEGATKAFTLQQGFLGNAGPLFIALERLGEGEAAFSLDVAAESAE